MDTRHAILKMLGSCCPQAKPQALCILSLGCPVNFSGDAGPPSGVATPRGYGESQGLSGGLRRHRAMGQRSWRPGEAGGCSAGGEGVGGEGGQGLSNCGRNTARPHARPEDSDAQGRRGPGRPQGARPAGAGWFGAVSAPSALRGAGRGVRSPRHLAILACPASERSARPHHGVGEPRGDLRPRGALRQVEEWGLEVGREGGQGERVSRGWTRRWGLFLSVAFALGKYLRPKCPRESRDPHPDSWP